MGNRRRAILRFKTATELLGEDQCYQMAAWQGIGLCRVYLRDLKGAKRALRKAEAIYQGMRHGPRQTLGLLWLSAEIALVEGDFLTAQVLLERIRSFYAENGNQLDFAAASLRLARALLLLGNQKKLQRVVFETTHLVRPLSHYKLATAILRKLHGYFTDGRLSAKILDRLFFDFRKTGRSTRDTPPAV